MPFASNAAWFLQTRQSNDLAPNSTALVANLTAQIRTLSMNIGGVMHINMDHHTIGVVSAPPGTPGQRVGYWNCNSSTTDGDRYVGRKIFVDVPIPMDARPAKGEDGQLAIYDPSSDKLWDFWRLRKASDGTWEACEGGRIDNVSSNRGYNLDLHGSSSSGMAIAGGAITMDEVTKGVINHALVLSLPQPAGFVRHMWPAQRSDGQPRGGPDEIEHGQRFRLDPSIDVSTLGLNRMGTMIAKALQDYGMIVTDSGGTVAFATEAADTWMTQTGKPNPWPTLMGGDEWQVLANLPIDRFQAMVRDYGK